MAQASRRPSVTSSVYQGADGYWHGRVTVGVKDDGDRTGATSRQAPSGRFGEKSASWRRSVRTASSDSLVNGGLWLSG